MFSNNQKQNYFPFSFRCCCHWCRSIFDTSLQRNVVRVFFSIETKNCLYIFLVLVKKICPQSDLKLAFNQLFNNRPSIPLYNNSASAAYIHQIWTEENLNEFHDCSFIVDSNLYSEYGRFGRGIFASIKNINFRQKPNGECIDYVRFTFDGARTEKICGSFDANSELGKKSFFNEGGGIMKIHIFVDKTIPLGGSNQRLLDIELVITAYESMNLLID